MKSCALSADHFLFDLISYSKKDHPRKDGLVRFGGGWVLSKKVASSRG